jgi:hypothetical protein
MKHFIKSIEIVKERKKYLIKKIQEIVTPFLYTFFKELYDKCVQYKNTEKLRVHELRILQDFMEKDVPKWDETYLLSQLNGMKIKLSKGYLIEDILREIIKHHFVIYNIRIDNFIRNKTVVTNLFIDIFKRIARDIYEDPYKMEKRKSFYEVAERIIDSCLENIVPIDVFLEEKHLLDLENVIEYEPGQEKQGAEKTLPGPVGEHSKPSIDMSATPSEIKKILEPESEIERLTTAKSENTSEKVPVKNTDLNSFLVSE